MCNLGIARSLRAMLMLHEVHRVRGAREDEFEAAFRDGLLPELAKEDDARLLYFMHLAHGSGRAYTVTTSPACGTVPAWSGWRAACGRATSVVGTQGRRASSRRHRKRVHRAVGTARRRPDEVPTVPQATSSPLFMGDTRWPHGGHARRVPREGAERTTPEHREGRGRGISSCSPFWQPAWGTGRTPRSCSGNASLPRPTEELLRTEVPPEFRAPGTHGCTTRWKSATTGEPPPPHHELVALS